jgi:redox-sensitive bicupin YhaK (pirin superfamily)
MQAQPMLIEGQIHDLGDGFTVRRMLPMAQARHVGPLVFFDHFGPATFAAGNGMDVRPHPHIGLATISWLFEGQIRHRDSLGSEVDIRPGEVNWMTAGRGIVHSERTPPEPRRDGQNLHGVQIWVALPQADAEVAPEFHHHDREQLPRIRQAGVEAVLISGDAYGEHSPVKIFAPMFLLEVQLKAGTEWPMPQEHAERGVLVIEGALLWGDLDIAATQMAVQTGPTASSLHAKEDSRVILFGGAPLDGDRHLWWNFVASSRERIEQAKADWQAQRFGSVPGDDQEFIPLPR